MTTAERAFEYAAADRSGARQRGVLWAATHTQVAAALATRGLTALSVRERRWVNRVKPTRRETTELLRQLSDLLGAGMPMLRAIDAAATTSPSRVRDALADLRLRIERGENLSEALEAPPLGLAPLLVGIIRAGEQGDGLAAGVARAAAQASRQEQLRRELSEALAYPVMLLLSGGVSVALLTGIVLPRFVTMIGGLHGTPPESALVLLSVAEITRGVTSALIVLGALLLALWAVMSRRDDWALAWARAFERIPVVGRLRRRAEQAHSLQALAALLDSGVPMRRTLAVLIATSTSALLTHRLTRVSTAIQRGASLSTALRDEGVLDGPTVHVVASAEISGQLATGCERAAAYAQRELDSAIRRGLRMLEPTIVVGLALVTAAVGAVLLQTMYALKP